MTDQYAGTRADLWTTSIIVDGVRWGSFATFKGGEASTEDQRIYPNSTDAEMSLGGKGKLSNVTVTRLWDPADARRIKALKNRLATSERVPAVVTRRQKTTDGKPYGDPEIYRGIVVSLKSPESDANSSSASMLEIEISATGTVG